MATLAPERRSDSSWFGRFLRWAAWPIVLAPTTIMLHEFGHLLAALALGFPDPAIHFSSISHGDINDRSGWQVGVVGLIGPLITIALILLAMAMGERRRNARWPHALLVSAASRLFVGVPYAVANIIAFFAGRRLDPPAFDEYKAGVALGWSGDAVLGASVAFFFVALIWLATRLPKGERFAAWPGLICGTILGWTLWFVLVGPILLP